MKIFFSFLIIFVYFYPSLCAKEILINTSAKIFQENKVHARNQALKNAFYDSVKFGVENLMDTNVINTHYGVIRKNIYKFSKNFIKNYELLNEEEIIDQKLYKISVKIEINIEKIKEKLLFLKILKEKNKRKRILVLFNNHNNILPKEKNIIFDLLELANQSFSEQNFLILDHNKLRNLYVTIEEEKILGKSLDSFFSLALIFNTDILILLGMNKVHTNKLKEYFNKVETYISFSAYDTFTGQNISETNVSSYETAITKLDHSEINNLLEKAAKQSIKENVRQTVLNINKYYQNLGILGEKFSVIFMNFSPQQKNSIIEYFEKTLVFRNISEIKNRLGYLELEISYNKRKSILRRRIISDLLKNEIEVATKSLDGNRLFFINPNLEEEIKKTDNFSKVSTKDSLN